MSPRSLLSPATLFRPPSSSLSAPVLEGPGSFASVTRSTSHSKRRLYVGTPGFGSSLQKFSINTIGTCYAARADGKPLLKEHVEAHYAYITDGVEPQLIAARAGLSANEKVPQREEILNSITKGSFVQYSAATKKTKTEQGNIAWQDPPSPYHIR